MPPEKTIQVTFIEASGTHKTVTAKENQSIMQAALEHKIEGIEGICGGCIGCATCHIYIPESWKSRVEKEDNEQSEEEIDMLDMSPGKQENSRLGCQIKLTKALNGLKIFVANT